ncbi:MAG: UDP-N-acetylenolpyruvoylglucosamine reductase [Flavobacteriaceae bacterium]|jgi:hypothetical protein|nr:UDP-N-acetylenolpyruvoylglucosamine reductase [Flavobacteriaceae bacterium]
MIKPVFNRCCFFLSKLVTSQIKTINLPFADLITGGFTHSDQIHLLRVGPNGKKIIADDLFVKLVKYDKGRPYYRGVISDSKLSSGSPWTDNQKSELINIFRDDKIREFIEFEVRTNNDFLIKNGAPNGFSTKTKIRVYREDVYKIISEGDNIKVPPLKMNTSNFR